MNATISTHLASVMTSRDASQRLRTSECIRVPAAPHLVRPGYVIGDQLWTHLQVGVPGTQVDLDVRLLTTRQALGGERRWFACPNCSRRVGCLYAPGITEPFWCRQCHNLLYDSQFTRRDASVDFLKMLLRLDRTVQRVGQDRRRHPGRRARRAGAPSRRPQPS